MYTVLAGGVGAARFLRGLVRAVPDSEVVVIVNVADDVEHLGLRVCPDLDTITYTLAGVVHPDQEWGRAEERFTVADELERLGHDRWLTIGDRDLAVHLHRTARLREGRPLSQVTAEIVRAFGVGALLLPVTDDTVETRVTTADGRELGFQEYWVRERAEPRVASLRLAGARDARPAPGVLEALHRTDAVIVAPSNPVVSIGTVLGVPGVREAVAGTPAPVIGVSPIVGERVVRGMADRLLPVVGATVSAEGVATHYGSRRDGGILDAWVVDDRDAACLDRVRRSGLACVATDTMMDDPVVATALARTVIGLAESIRR